MSSRKNRALADLYSITPTLLKPQITPVLSGSCRMQGPLHEADCDFQADMALSPVDQEFDTCSKNHTVAVTLESGKCNVCSPCSSCLHIQQGLMGSTLDENTGEISLENALSCSANDVPTTNKSARGEMGQLPEISNVFSGNFSCDSFPENAKWKTSSSIADVSAASRDVSLLQKVDCSRGSDAFDDNMSCAISTKKNSRSSIFIDRDGDGISLLSCPASTNSLVPEGHAKAPYEGISLGCIDKKSAAEVIQESSGWQGRPGEVSLGKVLPPTSSANDLSSQNTILMEIQSPKNTEDPDHLTEEGKSISQVQELNVLEKNACFPLQGKLLECRDEHLNPMTKEGVCDLPHCDPPADALREENEDIGRSQKSSVLPDTRDSSQSHLMDDHDDSEIVEQDVKVCDICGDAGREDLLAICCTCSDGAEHTYCMQEMLHKVPEGDWMCEECRYDEEMKNQRQENMVRADGNEKYSSSRNSIGGNSNVSLTLEEKCADEVDRLSKDHSHMKILGKRHRDDVELSSSAKKEAIEPSMGSPKESSPTSVASLSRDNSFKYMEKGKEKLLHQSPSVALVASDDSESVCPLPMGPLMQTTRGTFLKSNSSSSSNAKPKVKLVDDVVPPKQKIGREPSTLDLKEGTGKSLGKSISFRTMSPGRLATGEAKVKMLSPSFSHSQDNKGSKHVKTRSLLERKSSFRSERPFVNSPRIGSVISISKGDQKPAGRVGNALSSISSIRQLKAVQSDSKLSAASKPSALLSRRSSDKSVAVGEAKRQLASANGCRSSEQKPSQPSSISYVTEKPACNSKEILPDGTLRPRESANFGEKMWDNGSCFKQNVAVGGRTDICQKSEGAGHLTQFCTVEGSSDLCAAKSSRGVMNGSNDLKAAIEAARLRKPGVGQQHRVPDQSNCLSLASKNCEVAYLDQSSCSSIRKNASAGELNGGHTAPWYSTDLCRETAIDNSKQCTMETSTVRTGDGGFVPFDGKANVGDLSSYSPAISAFWKLLAIPEQESIWQGNFEVHRTVEVELFDGLQAHLSTCVSPKVLRVVNKLPQKIVLNEVPRLSTWPIQFQEFGVKEDNIALYFFAKDIVSFEKSYKNLLEKMVKDDLALKGNVDGVEILIFPSAQLPEKSQRWNMLFFLWGVFRGKKTSCSQQVSGSPKQLFALGDIPTAIMSLPENICSVGPIDKDFSSAAAAIVAEVRASTDGDGAPGIPSLTQIGADQQINAGQQDGRVDSNCWSSPQSSSTKSCEELRCTGTPLERGAHSNGKSEIQDVQGSVQAPGRTFSTRSEHLTVQWDTSPGAPELASSGSIAEGIVLDKMTNSIYQVNHRKDLRDETAEEARLGVDTTAREPIMKDPNRWHSKDSKLPHKSYRISTSDVDSGGTSQSIKINCDDKDEDVIVVGIGKGQKTVSNGLHGIRDQCRSSVDSFALPGHGIASGSDFANIGAEACRVTCRQESGNAAERYFFPVDPHPVKDIERIDKSVPWKIHSLEDQVEERTPNLELALGADTKLQGISSFLVGEVDKKVIHDHDPEKVVNAEGEDDGTASLSLSLSFPFPEKEQNVASIPKSDQLRTERQHVNSSLLLFGGIGDKVRGKKQRHG